MDLECVHRIECITRPIDDDQSAGHYDQARVRVDRRKPAHIGPTRLEDDHPVDFHPAQSGRPANLGNSLLPKLSWSGVHDAMLDSAGPAERRPARLRAAACCPIAVGTAQGGHLEVV